MDGQRRLHTQVGIYKRISHLQRRVRRREHELRTDKLRGDGKDTECKKTGSGLRASARSGSRTGRNWQQILRPIVCFRKNTQVPSWVTQRWRVPAPEGLRQQRVREAQQQSAKHKISAADHVMVEMLMELDQDMHEETTWKTHTTGTFGGIISSL